MRVVDFLNVKGSSAQHSEGVPRAPSTSAPVIRPTINIEKIYDSHVLSNSLLQQFLYITICTITLVFFDMSNLHVVGKCITRTCFSLTLILCFFNITEINEIQAKLAPEEQIQ